MKKDLYRRVSGNNDNSDSSANDTLIIFGKLEEGRVDGWMVDLRHELQSWKNPEIFLSNVLKKHRLNIILELMRLS